MLRRKLALLLPWPIAAEVSAARWMDLLTREVQLQLKELAQSLSQLDVIARLEDTSVARARQLLSSEAALAVSQSSNRSRHKLPETILEFKRRSSIWQECAAAQKALENVRQLVDTHREAAFQRDQARDLVAGSGTARRRTWPPVATTLEPERRDFEILEGEWTVSQGALRQCHRSGRPVQRPGFPLSKPGRSGP